MERWLGTQSILMALFGDEILPGGGDGGTQLGCSVTFGKYGVDYTAGSRIPKNGNTEELPLIVTLRNPTEI